MKNKAKIIVLIELDTDEYHVPADLNLREQLEDDVLSALESSMDIKVTSVDIKGLQQSDHADIPEDYN